MINVSIITLPLVISFKDDHINWQKFVNEEDECYN